MGGAGATGYEKLRRLRTYVQTHSLRPGIVCGCQPWCNWRGGGGCRPFVGGDSAGEDEGMHLCIGGDEVGNPLDVIQVQDPGSVTPTTRLLLSGDDTVFLVPPEGVGDLVEADTVKVMFLR